MHHQSSALPPSQVKEGDEVVPGDVLCDVETDKATMAWENQDEGFVARILLPDGAQNVPIGTPALLLVDDASDIAAFKDYGSQAAGASAEDSPSLSKESAELSAPDTGEQIACSPWNAGAGADNLGSHSNSAHVDLREVLTSMEARDGRLDSKSHELCAGVIDWLMDAEHG